MDDRGKIPPASALIISDDSAIAARLQEFVQDREAFSVNTWNQLLSVVRRGSRWARENGRQFLPMAPADLCDYLLWLQA